MTYKTILVHIDDSRYSEARTAFSLDLALKHDAHVIGLYIVCQNLFRPLLKHDVGLNLAKLEALGAEQMQRAREQFTAAAQRAGCPFEWRAPAGPAVEATVLHARHADLVVLGQQDPDDKMSFIARDFVEDVVMNSGRPVLVLPYAGLTPSFGRNVMVAWDGGRESARALADALPVLKHASFITVCVVEKHSDREALAGFDVSGYLERHRIRAAFASIPRVSGSSTGATLLNRLTDTHADLLVMGAYGHTRATEHALGGVTRTLLETMTVPVLMSH